MNRLEFKLDRIKPVSTNEMYSYGRKTVRKSNKYKAFESEVILQIRTKSDILVSGIINNFKDELSKDYRLAIKVIFKFYIPKRSYFRVDTSNYIKAPEDIIKNLVGIDDSRNVSVVADKYLSKDKDWHIQIELEIFQLSYEIPKNKWSENILGSSNKKNRIIKSRINPIKRKKSKRTRKTLKKEEVINLTIERLTINKDNQECKISKDKKSKKEIEIDRKNRISIILLI